jgi:copper chaperone CopZ
MAEFRKVFSIKGMESELCVTTVTENISAIKGVNSVMINLMNDTATVISERNLPVTEVVRSLARYPQYRVSATGQQQLDIYLPFILVVMFVVLVALAAQISMGHFDVQALLTHLLAGFFIGLSYFKLLDVNAFAEKFAEYDPLAKNFPEYGTFYPFIEVLLGLLLISGQMNILANVLTIIILTITLAGVQQHLQTTDKTQSATIGASFSLPLSKITIAENLIMIMLAIGNLLFLIK